MQILTKQLKDGFYNDGEEENETIERRIRSDGSPAEEDSALLNIRP